MNQTDHHSIRLQKYIADCGITSRRKAEDLIATGKVKVNGELVTELGTKVVVGEDIVQVYGEVIHPESIERTYIVLNKPRSVVTTVSDPEGRKTVMDCIKPYNKRVFPVGRLDYLSEGLIILTNDGELSNTIMHPRYEIHKVYEVKVFGLVNEGLLANLRKGVYGKEGLLKPKAVRVIKQLPNKTWLEFRLAEGKNREIRRICEACGLTVDKLRRVAIEGLSIRGLQPGDWRMLTRKELLFSLGLDEKGNKITHHEYVSPKKTIAFQKRLKFRSKEGKPADSKDFRKFKKERYFTTLKREKPMQQDWEMKQKTPEMTSTTP